MNANDIDTLLAYNRWANQRMLSALEKLTAGQLNSSSQSSFASIHETALHILAAEMLWLKRWKGNSPRATGSDTASLLRSAMSNAGVEVGNLSSVADLRRFCDAIDEERQQFLRVQNDDTLHARLHYTDMEGKEFSMPLAQLMQHVVNHGTYHRGQLTTLLRQAGAETVAFDMAFFFREQEQARAKSAD